MNTNPSLVPFTASHLFTSMAAKDSRLRASGKGWLRPALFALLILSPLAARASDPVGIYAIVDKVVLEPNTATPERIQIFGTFSLAVPGGLGDQYTAPQEGYLYYKLNPEKEAICQKEWADLKAVAGTQQCVAFASRHTEKGRVRKLDEKPANPDRYPVAQGITKVKSSTYPPVKRLYDSAAGPGKPATK